MTASGTLARAFVRSVVHSPDFALINWSEVKCALEILYFISSVVQRTFKLCTIEQTSGVVVDYHTIRFGYVCKRVSII